MTQAHPHQQHIDEWRDDQQWETRIIMTKEGPLPNPIWIKIPVGWPPSWDVYQEYRRIS